MGLRGVDIVTGPVVVPLTDSRAEGTVGGGVDLRLSRSFGVETHATYSRGSTTDLAMSRFQIGAGLVWWD